VQSELQKPAPCAALVIGFGNELRGDDGAGPKVAAAVAQWNLRGVRALSCHQLPPELADPIARARLVIFVDAVAGAARAVQVRELAPRDGVRSIGHSSDPRALLALARAVFGRCPRAWLVTIPAIDFDVGGPLSSVAKEGIQAALEQVRTLIVGFADGVVDQTGESPSS
jgi:hydrogenase maturation protease